MNIANALSILRIVLIIPILWLLFTGHRHEALAVFLFAAATDLIDGFVARKFNLKTTVGGFLDMIADKLLVFLVFTAFYAMGEMQILGFLIFTRDVCVFLHALEVFWKKGTSSFVMVKPIVLGKITTFLQVISIAALFFKFYPEYFIAVTVFVSIASGIEYLHFFGGVNSQKI